MDIEYRRSEVIRIAKRLAGIRCTRPSDERVWQRTIHELRMAVKELCADEKKSPKPAHADISDPLAWLADPTPPAAEGRG
jgi:hypothetical protein